MDYHAMFVSAATRLLGPDIAKTLGPPPPQQHPPTLTALSTSSPSPVVVPVCPDDLMAIFRTLRDRNIKFIAPKRSVAGCAPALPSSTQQPTQSQQTSSCVSATESSAYLAKHTFMRAVICAIDPLLQCDVHIAKRVKQTIEATIISITSDTTGVVKRFRAACGVRHPSAEDMRASLYESDIVMLDSHLNDIAIFQLTQSLKIGIMIAIGGVGVGGGTRIIPANLSIHDRAILVIENKKRFQCCDDGVSSGTLLHMLKKQTSMINGSLMPSMKVSEIRAILIDQIGIGSKQASEILCTKHDDDDDKVGMTMSKKNMLKILDILKSA